MLIVTNFEFTQLFRESVLSWRAMWRLCHKGTVFGASPFLRRIFAADPPKDLREL